MFEFTNSFVEVDLALQVVGDVGFKIGDTMLMKMLHLGQNRVCYDVSSTLNGLQIGFSHLASFLNFGRCFLHFSHCSLFKAKTQQVTLEACSPLGVVVGTTPTCMYSNLPTSQWLNLKL
jgi:hypothetical protein